MTCNDQVAGLFQRKKITKTLNKISTILLAGTTVIALGTAAMAKTGYTEMLQSVKDGLVSLQVPDAGLDKLSVGQLVMLSDIIDGTESNSDKQAAAEAVFRDAINPDVMSMTNAGAKQMEAELKADLEGGGLKMPSAQQLTFSQVQELLAVFETNHANDASDAAAILSKIEHPVMATMGNAGAMQLEAELKCKLESVGLTLPAKDKLTFQQVSELTAIFDQGGSNGDMKDAAMKVLGTN